MGGPNPYAVELVDEQSCRWNEGDVPLSERGVRFSWLCNFVRGIYWQLEQPVQEQSRLRDELRAWEHHKEHSWIYSDQPTPDHLKGATLSGPELKFDGLTIHELVGQHIVPLTAAIHAPLYARVPPSDRGKPGVFLSHAWANHVLSPVPQWGGGTLNAFRQPRNRRYQGGIRLDRFCLLQPAHGCKRFNCLRHGGNNPVDWQCSFCGYYDPAIRPNLVPLGGTISIASRSRN